MDQPSLFFARDGLDRDVDGALNTRHEFGCVFGVAQCAGAGGAYGLDGITPDDLLEGLESGLDGVKRLI